MNKARVQAKKIANKVFKDEINEEHYYKDQEVQRLNEGTLMHYHPTISSMMKPMFEPISEAILNP